MLKPLTFDFLALKGKFFNISINSLTCFVIFLSLMNWQYFSTLLQDLLKISNESLLL